MRVDHRHSIDDLTRLGADVERAVLSQALLGHCEDRIIRYGHQTMSSGVSRHLAGPTLIR